VSDRALEPAQTLPTGPVDLALPRAVLGEKLDARADAPRKPRAKPGAARRRHRVVARW
jgi:thiamine pyrophosphate-dependent acetolactate synthase large subunit-like protein